MLGLLVVLHIIHPFGLPLMVLFLINKSLVDVVFGQCTVLARWAIVQYAKAFNTEVIIKSCLNLLILVKESNFISIQSFHSVPPASIPAVAVDNVHQKIHIDLYQLVHLS